MDSVDFAALDFFVGAICVSSRVGRFCWCGAKSVCRCVDGYKTKLKVSAFALQLLPIISSYLRLRPSLTPTPLSYRHSAQSRTPGAVAPYPDLSIVYVG